MNSSSVCVAWSWTLTRVLAETFRFKDKDEIFSVLSIARAWTSVILAGKGDSGRRHSTTNFSENVIVTETSYQVLEVLLFCDQKGLNLLQ